MNKLRKEIRNTLLDTQGFHQILTIDEAVDKLDSLIRAVVKEEKLTFREDIIKELAALGDRESKFRKDIKDSYGADIVVETINKMFKLIKLADLERDSKK